MTMTVAELIAQLNELPQDAIVLTRGYESGMDAATGAVSRMIHKLRNNAWYDGEYDTNWLDDETYTDDILAVFIG